MNCPVESFAVSFFNNSTRTGKGLKSPQEVSELAVQVISHLSGSIHDNPTPNTLLISKNGLSDNQV